jgi:hypothetical protein
VARLAVKRAVEATLKAWPGCPPIQKVNEGQNLEGTGQTFIMVQYPVANNARTTHGRDFAEEGGVRIVIAMPSNEGGTDPSIELGEKLGDLFRARTIAGVEFRTPSTPLVHDDNDNGVYFKTSIVIPYFHQYEDEG